MFLTKTRFEYKVFAFKCKYLQKTKVFAIKRELSPLIKVKDNYEKIILSLDEAEDTLDGIKVINAINWLIC